jgi:hypothetical protein
MDGNLIKMSLKEAVLRAERFNVARNGFQLLPSCEQCNESHFP